MVQDMPKLHSPFARRVIDGNYVCIDEIEKVYDTPNGKVIGSYLIAKGMDVSKYPIINDYSWVFTDPKVKAIEKLHGTNVSIVITDGVITSAWNRTERIPFFNKGKKFITEAVLNSYGRGYCELEDGQWFGECIGPKVNGNPYSIDEHLWIPFKAYSWKRLAYKSWESGKYPKTFEAISEWFKALMPLYTLRIHGKESDKHFVEGVVFTHPDGRMAKLRCDMFAWYSGKRHNEDDMTDGN